MNREMNIHNITQVLETKKNDGITGKRKNELTCEDTSNEQ